MPIVHLPEVDLHYLQVATGTAPARGEVVMIHGLAASLAFWYLRLAPALADDYRVTLFDLRGHGRSAMPTKGYSPAAMAADLCGLLDRLGIGCAHVVAHSFGGLIALHFARLHPERVRSLTLLDVRVPALQGGRKLHQRGYVARIRALAERLGLPHDEHDPNFGFRLLEEMARWQLRAPERAARLFAGLSPFHGRSGTAAARHWLKLLEQTEARHELASDKLTADKLAPLTVPTLALYGEHSQALPSGEALHELWPHARFAVVPGAGHFFPASRPEVVMEALGGFLKEAA